MPGLPDLGNVAPPRNDDLHRGHPIPVILLERGAQPAGLHSDDRIGHAIEIGGTAGRDGEPDGVADRRVEGTVALSARLPHSAAQWRRALSKIGSAIRSGIGACGLAVYRLMRAVCSSALP